VRRGERERETEINDKTKDMGKFSVFCTLLNTKGQKLENNRRAIFSRGTLKHVVDMFTYIF
jgi:hypothetical protein